MKKYHNQVKKLKNLEKFAIKEELAKKTGIKIHGSGDKK